MQQNRRLANWLEGFMVYTEELPTSPFFREWAGIFLIAAALERKVYLTALKNRKLFANLQVFLVAHPGVGKTVLTSLVADLFEKLPEHKRAANDLSKASLIDELAEAKRTIGIPGVDEVASFNSLLVLSNELGALLPQYDAAFLNLITELYDCQPFSERRRARKKEDQVKIPNPQLNILCATTPGQLNELLPAGAWEQGFTARTFMVYEGDPVKTELFAENVNDKNLYNDLVEDLLVIGNLVGEMKFTSEGLEAARTWHRNGGLPAPTHPRLEHYKTRRTSMHVIKLAMIASILESNDLVITEKHFETAKNWLLKMERRIPQIFKSMQAGGDRQILMDVWHLARDFANKNGGTISHSKLFSLFQERTAESWKVPHLITSLAKSNIIKQAGGSRSDPEYSVSKMKVE